MIVGIGLDVVEIARIQRMLARWGERIPARVLTPGELASLPEGRAAEYVAGRIAAKEAASKALGVPEGIHWQCAEVQPARPAPPRLVLHGVARVRADALGVTRAHLTLTHDAGIAVAFVVLEA